MTYRLSIRTFAMLLLGAIALGLTTVPAHAGDFANLPLSKLAGAKHLNDASVLPVQSNPYGMSYSEWSAAWWQWAFSLPINHSPLFGADCKTGQSGHVWFLAGRVVGGPTPSQDCTVPVGTALFVAIINAECSNLEGLGNTEGEQRTCADSIAALIDPNSLQASLDGQPVTNLSRYLVGSPQFKVGPLPDNNLITFFCTTESCPAPTPEGTVGKAVGTGVYLMFNPLPVGQHLLKFHAEIPAGPLVIDTTYCLTIKP